MAPPSPCTHSWERGLPVCLGLRPPGYLVLPGVPALGAGEGGRLQQEEPGLLPASPSCLRTSVSSWVM